MTTHYTLDASDLFSFFQITVITENDKICLLKAGNITANINVKKLQFIHTGYGSKTAKS